MRTSESVKSISTDLAKAQLKIKHAGKDAVNPHFKNNYATLESVIDSTKSALLEHGIVVIQGMNDQALTTRLQHTSGEFIESDTQILLQRQDMQGLGSAITYARRYALAAMMNITQQDDDGNAASGNPVLRTAAPAKAKPAAKPAAKNDDF